MKISALGQHLDLLRNRSAPGPAERFEMQAEIGQVHMRDLFLEEYPWRQLITSLAAMKFDGYCFAEIPESGDPIRVLKFYRALFRAYQGL